MIFDIGKKLYFFYIKCFSVIFIIYKKNIYLIFGVVRKLVQVYQSSDEDVTKGSYPWGWIWDS